MGRDDGYFTVTAQLRSAVAVAAVALLASCGESSHPASDTPETPDPCTDVVAEAERLFKAAHDLEPRTHSASGDGWEGRLERFNVYNNDGARLIVDYPDCFSNSDVYDAKNYLGYTD